MAIFCTLAELRSILRRSAAVELTTARLPISPSNGLLNNPRLGLSRGARGEARSLSDSKFLPKGKGYQHPMFTGVGALSTNGSRCRFSSAILPFCAAAGGTSNSRDDADLPIRVLRNTVLTERNFPRVRKSRAEEPKDVRN